MNIKFRALTWFEINKLNIMLNINVYYWQYSSVLYVLEYYSIRYIPVWCKLTQFTPVYTVLVLTIDRIYIKYVLYMESFYGNVILHCCSYWLWICSPAQISILIVATMLRLFPYFDEWWILVYIDISCTLFYYITSIYYLTLSCVVTNSILKYHKTMC